MTFRDVSFSQATTSRNPLSGVETHELTAFAYDVIQGLFHYTVQIVIPPISSEMPPSLDVHLTGVYPLSVGLSSTNPFIGQPAISRPTSSALESSSTSHSLTPTYGQGRGTSNFRRNRSSQPEASSRGFLSTHSLGLQGKRAVWVERKRSSTVREVQVWSRGKPLVDLDGPVEIERKVVYSLESYDLRGECFSSQIFGMGTPTHLLYPDDITHCTFCELNGRIFLGYRSGDISFLDIN